MKIALCTNVTRSYCLFRNVHERISASNYSIECLSYLTSGMDEWTLEWEKKFQIADVIIIPWMGTGLDSPFIQKASKFMHKRKLKHYILVDNADKDKISYGFTEEQMIKVKKYFRYDGEDNLFFCTLWIANTFFHTHHQTEEPRLLPWNGVWHPNWTENCQDIEGYLKSHYQSKRFTVGIIFYRAEWLTGDFTYHTELINAFEKANMNVIAIFTNTMGNSELNSPTLIDAIRKYFFHDGKLLIDTLISTMKFSLKNAGTAIEELQKLNVPILEAYTILAEKHTWEESSSGLDPMEVSISVSLPEFDGVIHSVPIAAKMRDDVGEVSYEAIPERIQRLVNKAKKWAILRHKKNSEKKIAIIFHNYPALDSNIGSAAGLDSPESVRRLLQEMQDAGYIVENIPEDSKAFIELLMGSATNDRRFLTDERVKKSFGKITNKEYQNFYRKLPLKVQEQLKKDWGTEPGEVFHYDDILLVPGILNGNVFITVQPPRGFGEDPSKLLHSPDASPTHHYIGFYHWLRDLWQADAVIHVGTHGSLEWLPGKSTALSSECYPDVSLGDLPDIYPYWMTIVGEGIQAKRRGAACLISHLSPPMQLAGSFDDIEELEKALEEYFHFSATQPENLEAVADIVREKAQKCNLDADVPEGTDFAEYVGRLHNYITDLKNMQIRTGLHIMGNMPQGDDLLEYILALTRLDNGKIPSLLRVFVEEEGFTYEELLTHSQKMLEDGTTYGVKIDSLEKLTKEIVTFLAEKSFSLEAIEDVLLFPYVQKMSENGKAQLKTVLQYIVHNIVPNLAKTKQELTNIINALQGAYIEPSPAGAPTSGGADLLPTGRNFYGVDPRCLPTPAAWELGKKLGDEVVAQYIADEGRYPEAVGIVLWAGANMRSHGQCVAEFLYLMGIKPVWQRPSMRVASLEVIPLKELKRPRIDVTGRISGLFRDSMPDSIHWLDNAVQMVIKLDESDEDNYIRKHVLTDASFFENEGDERQEAFKKASYRIFGDPPSTYGAGVGALLESKKWDTLEDLAEVYTRFSGTAYSSDALPQNYEPQVFRRRMEKLEVTIKNEDNREAHMFSSDDYNAYHGGMIATVRALTGKTPHSYIGDSTDRKDVKVRTVKAEAKRLFRAEAMNPKFIEGMKKHGYKGAADLANYIAHSYQWDATSKVMEDWMYEKFAEKYALDKDMQDFMRDVNPWALHRIADILLEADQRGLWQALPKTKEKLQALYLEMEGEMEARADE